MSVLYHPPRWKTILSHPRYELSEEGQVRVKSGFSYAGRVLTRFWKDGYTVVGSCDDPFERVDASLCVELHDFPRHTTKRVWRLMEQYWPGVEYPESWRKRRKPAKPVKPNNEPDKRYKLTDQQVTEIRQSLLSSGDLAKIYPVSARHIRAIRQNKKRTTYA